MTVTIDYDGRREKCVCIDAKCPYRECFAPGHYQHRSCNNVHNSGYDDHLSCLNNQYHGCPDPLPEPEKEARNA